MSVDTGLQAVGPLEWGTHFCHFYRDQADVAETLVPYFKTGLENNEACLWVTAEPFSKEAAFAHLRVYFPDLPARIRGGQLTVLDSAEWYAHVGRAHAAEIVDTWIAAKDRAVERGHAGLRLSGNMAFVREEDWDGFNAYETAVGHAFADQQILALCSYEADRWDMNVLLDVVQTHDFALARRRSRWEMVESTSASRSKAALARQQLLAAELSHRVKNSIASVQSLVDQSLRRANSPAEARASIFGRLTALARAHEQLAAGEWKSASLREIVEGVVAAFGTQVQLDVGAEILTTRATLDLSLVLHELMTNAVKYGSLGCEGGSVTIRSTRPNATGRWSIVWTERGGRAVDAPTRRGFGTALAEQLIVHDLRGECEFAYDPQGLRCTLLIPVKELIVRTGCVHCCTL